MRVIGAANWYRAQRIGSITGGHIGWPSFLRVAIDKKGQMVRLLIKTHGNGMRPSIT